ncbi:hypothetical protein APY03_7437 [Variovorax sp. WDL1]|nr:hypothetical protein APY03_7437 [Variovorax sp. WDL1]
MPVVLPAAAATTTGPYLRLCGSRTCHGTEHEEGCSDHRA